MQHESRRGPAAQAVYAHSSYETLRRSPDRTIKNQRAAAGAIVNVGRDLEERYQRVGEEKGLNWQRHPIRGGNTKYPGGYTGWVQQPPLETHVLDSSERKIAIRGYSGFRPNQGTVVGVPIIPSVEEQEGKERNLLGPGQSFAEFKRKAKEEAMLRGVKTQSNFHMAAKNMDLLERYNVAKHNINERGQTPEYLLAQVQAKLSSKVNSYAEQQIRLRKLFESFDWDGNGVLDETEFRACLERMNVQFDDFQVLALFAYFDMDNEGFVDWKEFSEAASVPNSRGGTAILPNPIIHVAIRG